MTNSKKEILRTIKFVLFSASAGIIQVLSFALLEEVLHVTHWISYLVSLVLSVLWNFTLNRKFTFHSANNVPVAMMKVAVFYIIFTPLSTWWTAVLTGENVGWNEYLVLAGTMLINFVTEYLYDRFVVFGKSIDTAIIIFMIVSMLPAMDANAEEEHRILSVVCEEPGTINAAFGTIVEVPKGKYRAAAYIKETEGTVRFMVRYANTFTNTDTYASHNGGTFIRSNFTPVDSSYFDSSDYPATQTWKKKVTCEENYSKYFMEMDLTELSGQMVSDGNVNLLIGCDFIDPSSGYVYGFELYALNEAGQPVGQNLIENGTFSDGTNGWTFRDGSGANPSLKYELLPFSALNISEPEELYKIPLYLGADVKEDGDRLIISNESDGTAIAKFSNTVYCAADGYDVDFVLEENSTSDIQMLLGFYGTNVINAQGIRLRLMEDKIRLAILGQEKDIQSLEYNAPKKGDAIKVRVINEATIEVYINEELCGSYYLADQIGHIPDGSVGVELNHKGDTIEFSHVSVGPIDPELQSNYLLKDIIEFEHECYNILGSNDLDKDGYPDLVVTSNGNIYSSSRAAYNNKVYICYGVDGGFFEEPVSLEAGVIPYELTMEDLNGDGWADIVVGIIGDIDGDDIVIYLNQGGREYTRKTMSVDMSMGPLNGRYSSSAIGTIGQQGGVLCPAAADFDNDGYVDLVVTGYDRSVLYVYRGDGTGEFEFLEYYQSSDYGYGLHTVKAADFDQDGNMDLVVTNQDHYTSVEVFRGNGDCTFTLMHKYDFADGSISYHVALEDFNKDGKLDYITSQYNGGIELFMNESNGVGDFNFSRQNYSSPNYSQVREILTADLNADGESDVALLSRGTNCLSILYGTGNYTDGNYFADPVHYFVDRVPKGLAIEDFNGDGAKDLALLRYSGKDIMLLFGTNGMEEEKVEEALPEEEPMEEMPIEEEAIKEEPVEEQMEELENTEEKNATRMLVILLCGATMVTGGILVIKRRKQGYNM